MKKEEKKRKEKGKTKKQTKSLISLPYLPSSNLSMGKKRKKASKSESHEGHDDVAEIIEDLEQLLLLDEEEVKTLEEFRAECDPQKKYSDDMLLKFLRAKKWDKKKAQGVLKNYMVRERN